MLKTSEEFIVGKHGIGWIDSNLAKRVPGEFDAGKIGTFQTLKKTMTDAEIESELKPGICTIGDVLDFLKNPPEGSKDGNWNLFYLEHFVVGVRWGAWSGFWRVYAWRRGDNNEWDACDRLFSPATKSEALSSSPSDTVTLPEILVVNGVTYKRD